ncbi:3'-5' exoribonuclease [Escherichia coli]|nr:3'-5' exoribonuclease [Escherichia coli]
MHKSVAGEFQKEVDNTTVLLDDILSILALLEAGDWSEHCTKTELGGRLEREITRLIGDAQEATVTSYELIAEARAAICIDDTLSISDALSELSHFINQHADNTKYLKVWGNGATFDNVILRGAYERAGQICPWAYWNDHDVRTIVTLGRSIGFDPKMDMPFDGERHNALADARHQAKYVSAIWQKLIPATSTEL